MLKKIALAVLLLCKAATAQNTTTLDPGQIYNTGNLVNWGPATSNSGPTSPWINGVYQQSLTCWGPGGPGNCGPTPTVTPGNINFSYGMTDIYQITNVAAALPNSGTGLRVNGYNFGFMAKNGNGWDNGQQDYLSAYVKFSAPDGSTVRNDYYDLNSKFNWTYFNYNKTFDTPYASKDLSTVQYGFVGADSNFWAGTYGPEVTNISFSLKYSVDPCATNPMYSPTCPGYLDALAKLVPQTTAVADPIVSTVTDPVASVTSTTTGTSSTSIIGQTSIVAPIVSAPAPTTVSSTSSQTQKESSGSNSNTSLALSIISKNSDRDQAGSAVAQAAVSQAQAAATQAQQEAASVAASAVANSTTMNAVTISSQQSSGTGIRVSSNNSNTTNFTLQSGVTSLVSSISGPQTNNNSTSNQQQNSSGLGLNVSNNQPVIVTNAGTQQSAVSETVTTFALPLLQPQQPVASVVAPTLFGSFEQPQVQQQTTLQSSSITSQSTETYSATPSNFLTDRSNPLTDIVEGKNTVPQNSTIATTGSSVNRNSSDNEVAGGVDINKMALAPVGYGDYLNLTLRDAAFYAPKEVYKNQRNVDNVRVLRQLSSDSKHREMVDMQYVR